jgi:hypothetical protein
MVMAESILALGHNLESNSRAVSHKGSGLLLESKTHFNQEKA